MPIIHSIKPEMFTVHKEPHLTCIIDQGGLIITGARWRSIIDQAAPFYDTYPDQDIEDHNASVMENQRQPETREEPRASLPRVPRKGYIYLMIGDGYHKIGQSNNPQLRLNQIGKGLPFPLTLIHTVPTDDMEEAEQRIHAKFAEQRIHGEWFALSHEDTEWFAQLEAL